MPGNRVTGAAAFASHTRPLATASALLALIVAASACSDEPPTGILIAITAQGRTTEIVDTLEVKTFGGEEAPTSPTGEQRYPLPVSSPWPVLVGLTPRRGDTSRVWAVEIRALRIGDGTGDLQLVRRLIGTYARGKVALLHVELEDLCLLERNRDLECGTELARTCLAGECVETPTIDPGQLPPWDGMRPPDDGGMLDARQGSEDASDFDVGGEQRDARAEGGRDGGGRDTGPVPCTEDDDCDDAIECTVDRCIDGICERVPDDALCPTTICTAAVRCIAGEGGCVEESIRCDDGISCTADSCDPTDGCHYEADDSLCGEGATCDLGLHGCRGGACDTSADCVDADLCNQDNCVGGICEHPPGTSCPDATPCTVSRCVPATGDCEVTDTTAFCDDGNLCTSGDRCASGTCSGTPDTCGSGDPCSMGMCDGATGSCSATTLPDGSDCGTAGGECCSGRCAVTASDPLACGGCGIACGSNERCAAGVCECVVPWLDCDGAPGCEINPGGDPMHCSGCNMPCDPGESCVDGVCQACTTDDQCTPPLSCQAGTCDSGVCETTTDPGYCVIAGACVLAGAADPMDGCRSCQPAVDPSAYTPRGGMCSDGLFCNVGETCGAGTCGGGAPRSCDDAKICTMDVCDEAGDRCNNDTLVPGYCLISGTCHTDGEVNPVNPCQRCDAGASTTAWSPNDGAMCADSMFCTTNACTGTSCGVTGMVDCADAYTCTTDSCNETTDSCDHPIDAGSCLIDGACRADGEDDPSNDCRECAAATSQTAWTTLPDGTPCATGTCAAGICSGGPIDGGSMDLDGDIRCLIADVPDAGGCI